MEVSAAELFSFETFDFIGQVIKEFEAISAMMLLQSQKVREKGISNRLLKLRICRTGQIQLRFYLLLSAEYQIKTTSGI